MALDPSLFPHEYLYLCEYLPYYIVQNDIHLVGEFMEVCLSRKRKNCVFSVCIFLASQIQISWWLKGMSTWSTSRMKMERGTTRRRAMRTLLIMLLWWLVRQWLYLNTKVMGPRWRKSCRYWISGTRKRYVVCCCGWRVVCSSSNHCHAHFIGISGWISVSSLRLEEGPAIHPIQGDLSENS